MYLTDIELAKIRELPDSSTQLYDNIARYFNFPDNGRLKDGRQPIAAVVEDLLDSLDQSQFPAADSTRKTTLNMMMGSRIYLALLATESCIQIRGNEDVNYRSEILRQEEAFRNLSFESKQMDHIAHLGAGQPPSLVEAIQKHIQVKNFTGWVSTVTALASSAIPDGELRKSFLARSGLKMAKIIPQGPLLPPVKAI